MAKAVGFSLNLPGAEGLGITINYNSVNLRITTVDWVLANAVVARVKLWDTNQPTVLIYDRTLAGASSGSENVPGNWRMEEKTEDGQTFLDLPARLGYQVTMETFGI